MGRVYEFPGPEDRDRIRTILRQHAADPTPRRQRLCDALAEELRKYRVRHLRVDNCVIRLLEQIVTPLGRFEAVLITGLSESYDRCPACKELTAGYLAGEAPAITVSCRSCGCIYNRSVSAEETKAGEPIA